MSRAERIVVTTVVDADPTTAFEIFTAEVDAWWKQGPRFRPSVRGPGVLRFEAGVGGHLLETYEDESTFVFGRVRHPMYASIWLWAVAQGTLLQNWFAGWSLVSVFAAMYFLRTPREEQLMCESFGDAYHEYMRRTGRLFPRIKMKAEGIA